MEYIETRQTELVKLLQTSTSPDPLVFDTPGTGLYKITDDIKTSIGKVSGISYSVPGNNIILMEP